MYISIHWFQNYLNKLIYLQYMYIYMTTKRYSFSRTGIIVQQNGTYKSLIGPNNLNLKKFHK